MVTFCAGEPDGKAEKSRLESLDIASVTRVAVEGFKSIHQKRSIDIRPLTILAGANSSGKSTIMQPLLLLKQTLEAGYDPGPLLLDGPNVRFTSADQLLSRTRKGRVASSFSVEISTARSGITIVFRTEGSTFEIAENGDSVSRPSDDPAPRHGGR